MKHISLKLSNFLSDESGELTVEIVILMAGVIVLCIGTFILLMPTYHDTRDYSVAMLDFEQSGVENPECRYVKGYQESPRTYDSNGNVIASCTMLYELQRNNVDPLNPVLTQEQALELIRLYRAGTDFQDLEPIYDAYRGL